VYSLKYNSDILDDAGITFIKYKFTALKNRNFGLNSNTKSIPSLNHLNLLKISLYGLNGVRDYLTNSYFQYLLTRYSCAHS
jgi:hypothetical protein